MSYLDGSSIVAANMPWRIEPVFFCEKFLVKIFIFFVKGGLFYSKARIHVVQTVSGGILCLLIKKQPLYLLFFFYQLFCQVAGC
ncbi:hypothetical protein C0971_13495 [Bacillus methanolicus]|nr:hypothetical protein C0971_13495 [Bacillus methanolicus]